MMIVRVYGRRRKEKSSLGGWTVPPTMRTKREEKDFKESHLPPQYRLLQMGHPGAYLNIEKGDPNHRKRRMGIRHSERVTRRASSPRRQTAGSRAPGTAGLGRRRCPSSSGVARKEPGMCVESETFINKDGKKRSPS